MNEVIALNIKYKNDKNIDIRIDIQILIGNMILSLYIQ